MRYCTRAVVHVDRCACAWLIRRFLDPQAEFVFVDGQPPLPAPDAIPFDMHGALWGHRGDDCSFETIVKLHNLTDPALLRLARIVHGADITADADETLESAGIDLLFKGLRPICGSDQEAIERGYVIFDALYAALGGGGPT